MDELRSKLKDKEESRCEDWFIFFAAPGDRRS